MSLRPLRIQALLSLALVVLAAYPCQALRFYVDGVSGIGDDRRSVTVAQNEATPWKTIGHALTIAHLIPEGRPHVIRIAPGTYTPDMESFPLRISQAGIYLESGGNLIFDALGSSRIIEITGPSNLVLKDISFVNGLADRGGAIYCQTCSLRVVNNRIIGNRSTLGGDVIYQDGGRLEFSNNVVRHNGAPGGGTPLIEIHNTFAGADTSRRDVIRNNTFFKNETPVILTSGNRTDISSNIFNGTSGSSAPAIIDSASVGPLVRYNLFWETDILLIEGQDSVKVSRTVRDTTTLEELGIEVPSFVTNQPDTVAKVDTPYDFLIDVVGDSSNYRFTPFTLPSGVSSSDVVNFGRIRWTPAAADTGRHEIRIEIIDPSGGLGFLTYNIRVFTAENFPDTTDKGPQVTVSFVPDTTGAIDSLNLTIPVFSSAASAGNNVYFDPIFLNTAINRFELLAVNAAGDSSKARDGGNPIAALRDPQQGGRNRVNDIGNFGGPTPGGPPAPGTHVELTLQALPDSVATEGVPWTYDPQILEVGTYYLADVVTDLARVPVSPPPSLVSVMGSGKVPPYVWTPAISDTGTYLVLVETYTSAGSGRHFFPLRVRPENEPPIIASTAPAVAYEDSLLTYAISASDPNGDVISYSLLTGPEGLTVDAAGLVQWLPSQADIGAVEIQLAATDPKGAAGVQSFTLTVLNTNDAPTLAAAADTTVIEDVLLQLLLEATDIDSADALTWSIASGADSATVDSSGRFLWTPVQADVGANEVTVQVADLAGATATTTFAVTVIEVDEAPVILSSPDTTALEDSLYTYAVSATDEEGAISAYTLTVSPAGMAIDSSGVVTWSPAAGDVGTHAVEVAVADSAAQLTSQSYSLVVIAVNDAPVIHSRSPVDSLVIAVPGASLDLSVTASDEEDSTLAYLWTVNGVTQAANGAALSVTPRTVAIDTVLLRVSDGVDTTATQWLIDGRAIARLALSADSLAFGQIGLGDTSATTVTLENSGSTDLEISSLQVGDLQFSASFAISTVPAGGQAVVTVRFSPTARGKRSSAIQFATNDPDRANVSIAVAGTGVVPTALSLDLDPAASDQGLRVGSAAAGDTITVDVYATRSLDLTSYILLVAFDPALASFAGLDLRGPEATSLLEAGGSSLIPTVTTPADSLISIAVSPQSGALGVSADGILGRLAFVASESLTILSDLDLRLVRAELTSTGQATPDTVLADPAAVSVGPSLAGDFDGNGVVDIDDFFLFADNYGIVNPLYDLDGSGGPVNIDDFFVFADNFGGMLARPGAQPAGAQLEGLAWHSDQADGQVTVAVAWNGDPGLRGLAVGLEYDAEVLRFAEYRCASDDAPLTWVVEDRPGWMLLALGNAASRGDLTGSIIDIAFERLSAGPAELRPTYAVGHLAGTESMALSLPGAAAIEALPVSHALDPAYPNPFNPETVLSFSLAVEGPVTLRIYDLLGREVTTVLDDALPRGRHRAVWRARDDSGRPVAAGLYLAELRAGDFRQVRKLMLLK